MDQDRNVFPIYSFVNGSSKLPHTEADCFCHTVQNLSVGCINMSQLSSEMVSRADEFDPSEIARFVLGHISSMRYDIFYVHGMNKHILIEIYNILEKADHALGLECYPHKDIAEFGSDATIEYVSLHSTAKLTLVKQTEESMRFNRFFAKAVDEYRNDIESWMEDEEPEDKGMLIETYKLKSLERYVKILSLFLPKTHHPMDVANPLYNNISLKHFLNKFFPEKYPVAPPSDIARKCTYFVVGSIFVTEDKALLKSVENEILTAGKLTVVAPDYVDFSNPYCKTVNIEKLQFYDRDQAVPLPISGMTCFIYHSENDEIHMVSKMEPRNNLEPLNRGYENIYACGGNFILNPPKAPNFF